MKKQNAGDRHDRGASGENCRNCGERSALLEQKEERDRSCADTDSSEQRVIEPGAAEFLVPASAEPENRQINQDRQGGAGFDYETAETIADPRGGETCKNLVRAVKNCCYNCVPEPRCHGTRD